MTEETYPHFEAQTKAALEATLAALRDHMHEAEKLSYQAWKAIQSGAQNEAIGTILVFEKLLPEASALIEAAKVLHRRKPRG